MRIRLSDAPIFRLPSRDNRRFPAHRFAVALAFVAAAPCLVSQVASRPAPPKASPSEYPGTAALTLPGTHSSATEPRGDLSRKVVPEPKPAAPGAVAASLALAPTAGDGETERHYRTAILAMKDENLAIAAEEMNEAAKLSPENALIVYGLAVIQARNLQPELALPNIEKAEQLGLPNKEAAEAEGLVTSIRYAIKKDEAAQKEVTPTKLWGSYDAPLDEPVQGFEESGGHTIFKSRTPLARGMYLWQIDGESTIIGHWLEKDTTSEETIYKDSKRHDAKPKTATEEHWWLVSILINPDGSLDGSRIETCSRKPGLACAQSGVERGKVITFKGHLASNGDLMIEQADTKQEITLKKTSRLASLPPAGVHIRME